MLKIWIYIGINAHVTPADRHTDGRKCESRAVFCWGRIRNFLYLPQRYKVTQLEKWVNQFQFFWGVLLLPRKSLGLTLISWLVRIVSPRLPFQSITFWKFRKWPWCSCLYTCMCTCTCTLACTLVLVHLLVHLHSSPPQLSAAQSQHTKLWPEFGPRLDKI